MGSRNTWWRWWSTARGDDYEDLDLVLQVVYVLQVVLPREFEIASTTRGLASTWFCRWYCPGEAPPHRLQLRGRHVHVGKTLVVMSVEGVEYGVYEVLPGQ